ncbi:MAG: murein L,D-transpeptidase catalytic domain family protein [Phycisphaerales bacterium]|nr:murein L,D-transpeptidase catalytic domain family protein [Phycisphaerales bacterium]
MNIFSFISKRFCSTFLVLQFMAVSVWADNNNGLTNPSSSEHISSVYEKINFCRSGKLNPIVFEYAYKGYLNLKAAGKLTNDKDLLSVCDYSLSANVYRFWIIDLSKNKVLFNTYVAHGQGTGEEFARSFSNIQDSHQSSLGFYVTSSTYIGDHGLSLYLHGMDQQYNSAAYERDIVVHGADYVSHQFIQENQRLGRSWGCPAVPDSLASEIIQMIKDGTCLFIYYPHKKYLASSYWLNKKSNKLKEKMQQQRFELAPPQQPDGDETKQLVGNN